MDVITLRTMARKSVFNFGKYINHTVQQLLDLKKYRTLRWYYYNMSGISFLPDILEEIGITEKWRIEKPGTNEEMDARLQEQKDKNFNRLVSRMKKEDTATASETYKSVAIKRNKNKSKAREKLKEFLEKDKKFFSKGAMQWRNHGHF